LKELCLNGKYGKGLYALIDDDDYERVSVYKWWVMRPKHTMYVYTQIDDNGRKKTIMLHRFIMNVSDPNVEVDHINGNGLDNRKENLRLCFNGENNRNSRPHRNSSSKYKGVCWHKKNKKWQADIYVNGKHIYLGQYDSEIEAAKAYDRAAIKYFGRFAKLNFPEDYPDYAA
jgi:hypothetical protein